ncbi:glycosyltransferase [Mycolicibacterium sp. 120270]|uniref:glycosyltransferase n=1 Tax=Mycolicibacterium sp. 120270 TaxID=3090600 RepID=UPI00299D4303|nr:glycosyltransferase [Mycolicibacterium sp. 120270]MDX1883979.1 glycosyltransferase [Mycolicibacterium sp. 120270]
MKCVLVSYGSRGDVEPAVAVGCELVRRGHDIHIVVPPDLVGFAETAGLSATGCGIDARQWVSMCVEHSRQSFRPWRIPGRIRSAREVAAAAAESWASITSTLMSLAGDADLLITGSCFEGAAANVAEYHGIPLTTLHYLPLRPNGQLLALRPRSIGRTAMATYEWLSWRSSRKLEDAQRRELGLPKTTGPVSRRITARGSLEIQAYDEACFPGLRDEWTRFDGQRPFVGTMTLEFPTDADEEVASWIAAGTPPVFFSFGSLPVDSAAEALAMIGSACAEIGERALVCSAASDFADAPHMEHVKVVRAVNYAAIFPLCRAVVHHGGSGTTAAGLRAGVPTLMLLMGPAQIYSGVRPERLGVGVTRPFSKTTERSLVADLRRVLDPQCVARARDIATRMTKPADSVAAAADRVEVFARQTRVG